ncbi:hypothetical protein [Paracoccus ravus]|nr:hypothetical protein [Paracoccus ravus]
MRTVWPLLLAALLAACLAALAFGDQRLGLGHVLGALPGAQETPPPRA